MKLLHDQHTHSSFSRDSKEDLRNYYLQASKLGIPYVCTTEHFDLHTSVDGTTWDADYDTLINYQKELKKEFPNITPLLGIEVGYRPDYYNDMVEMVNKYDFDLVQLSIHDRGDKNGDYYFKEAFEKGIDVSLNEYFERMLNSLDVFPNFDVLSHFDYGYKTVVLMDKSYELNKFEDIIKKIFTKLVKMNKPLEINSKVLDVINNKKKENDDNYQYDDHLRYVLKLYKECGGVKLTLSSDAHTVEKYRLDFDKHLAVIKEMGFTHLSYFIKRKEYLFEI